MAVVATGFFDGVHLGHQSVVRQLIDESKKRGTESIIITFWPHPRNVLQQDARELKLLSSVEEKKQLLYALGVDRVEILPFNKKFSQLGAKEYLQEYLMGHFGAQAILLGYDNRFGNTKDNKQSLEEIAQELGLEVIRAEKTLIPMDMGLNLDACISSTLIRKLLLVGRVEQAAKLLNYEYFLQGVIVAGQQLGRTIGFPTANMELTEPRKLIPENGVYLVRVHTTDRDFWGMCNIGLRPTVSIGQHRTIETNIFDFNEDIYGLDFQISIVKRIRPEQKFKSLEQLRQQLHKDKESCLAEIKSLQI